MDRKLWCRQRGVGLDLQELDKQLGEGLKQHTIHGQDSTKKAQLHHLGEEPASSAFILKGTGFLNMLSCTTFTMI